MAPAKVKKFSTPDEGLDAMRSARVAPGGWRKPTSSKRSR
jgi:hypothetical protein